MIRNCCTTCWALAFYAALLCQSPDPGLAAPPAAQKAQPVFAFCYDTHDALRRNFNDQAKMLDALEFDGVGHIGLDKIDERLQSLEGTGLKLYLAGISLNVTQPIEPQLEALTRALPLLSGKSTVIYAVVTGLPPGDPAGRSAAIAGIREFCELAAQVNLRIGIYPHTGDWVATVPQAVQLARDVARPECGVIFNLCHFLRNEPLDALHETLEQAAPHLVGVTINGADLAGLQDKDWKRLIQPLDRGTFDWAELLRELDRLDYSGPVGIMCYGIGGDAQEHLARSIKKWRHLRDGN
jgi:sugar phosphate isomerase/epimerase